MESGGNSQNGDGRGLVRGMSGTLHIWHLAYLAQLFACGCGGKGHGPAQLGSSQCHYPGTMPSEDSYFSEKRIILLCGADCHLPFAFNSFERQPGH